MPHVRANAIRWVDDGFPGWVEVELAEADGSTANLVDKAAAFGNSDRFTSETRYPVAVDLRCEVLGLERDQHDQDVAIIVLHHGIVDRTGRAEFRVQANQLR